MSQTSMKYNLQYVSNNSEIYLVICLKQLLNESGNMSQTKWNEFVNMSQTKRSKFSIMPQTSLK